MTRHKIVAIVFSGAVLVGSAFVVAQGIAALDRKPVRAVQALVDAGAVRVEAALGQPDVPLQRAAVELGAHKDVANTLRQLLSVLGTLKADTPPNTFQQMRIDKLTEKLDELREEFRAAHPEVSGVTLIDDAGVVVHSDTELFAAQQSVRLPAFAVPPPPPSEEDAEEGGEEEEAEPGLEGFAGQLLGGLSGQVMGTAAAGLSIVAGAPIPQPGNRKKVMAAVVLSRRITELPATPGVETFLSIGDAVVMGQPPAGFSEGDKTHDGPVLLVVRSPDARVAGLWDLPWLGLLPTSKDRPGVWGRRFVVPGAEAATGYVFADASGVYAELRGLEMLAVLLGLLAWAVVVVLIVLDGRGLRRGMTQLADFIGLILQGATQERAVAERDLPKDVHRLGKLINQVLENYVGGAGSVRPLPTAPSVDQVLAQTQGRDAVVPTSNAAPDFENLKFEGISNSGTLEADELQIEPAGTPLPPPAGADADGFDDAVAEAGADLVEAEVEQTELPAEAAITALDALERPRPRGAASQGETAFAVAGEIEFPSAPEEEEIGVVSGGSETRRPTSSGLMELTGEDDFQELAPEEIEPAPMPPSAPSAPSSISSALANSALDNALLDTPPVFGGDATAVMKPTPEMLAELRAIAQAEAAAKSAPTPVAPTLLGTPKPAPMSDAQSTAVMKVTPELLAQMRATAAAEEKAAAAKAGAKTLGAPSLQPPIPAALDDLSGGATAVMKVSPELLAQMRQAAGGGSNAGPAEDPEAARLRHFREVFDAFVETRTQCGEVGDLSYDKFAKRLEQSRAAVIAKHQCTEVRFQVYVKDGKAALKATPAK